MNTILIKKVKNYCTNILINSRCKSLPFHSVQHTLEVFENVQIIGKYKDISEEDLEILKIAALFHDTGISQNFVGHENISTSYASTYLSELNFPNKNMNQVLNCIKSTQMPQNPKTPIEKIICDVDLFHLAAKNYLFKNELLRNEWQTYMNLKFTDADWYQLNLDFLSKHKYHTMYGKKKLEKGKNKNIILLENLLSIN